MELLGVEATTQHLKVKVGSQGFIKFQLSTLITVSLLNIVALAFGTYKDPKLYEAAAKGDIEPFKAFKDMAKEVIELLLTLTNNTILHINIRAPSQDKPNTMVSSTKFVEEILDLCPSLLLKVNDKGDTPLRVAVKCDRDDIERVLIEKARCQHDANNDLESGTVGAARCREMIGMLNNEKNTALHEAVRCGRLDIVKRLMKEEPEFAYSTNSYGETPLYMAAAKKPSDMVAEILDHCPSPADQGPDGKTALHAAVNNDDYDIDVIKKIVERKKSLVRDQDQYGWTPLHYAAYFGYFPCAKVLLERDRSAAMIVDRDRKMTALHLAAAQGDESIVQLLISSCPECCELVDARGWNVLHFAVLSFDARQLKNLLKDGYVRNLINEKDVNGNTPLHGMAAFCGYSTRIIIGREGNYAAVNKQNISVGYIMTWLS